MGRDGRFPLLVGKDHQRMETTAMHASIDEESLTLFPRNEPVRDERIHDLVQGQAAFFVGDCGNGHGLSAQITGDYSP